MLWRSTPAVPPQSSLAVISLVCAILGIAQLLPIIGPIAAIVAGHMAQRELDQAGGRLRGRGLAKAGLVIAYLTLGLYVLGCLLLVLVVGLSAMIL
ncbi:MAG: DUF4190 domain-containing protein [Roseiflexaceae bacterium]|nr:DUF4190 domain-containing protein [Roseiflexaceae bacterium]